MAETLVERCYFVLKGFSEELKAGLHEKEPKYATILDFLTKLLESNELDKQADSVLIRHIRQFLSYGIWEYVYPVLAGKTGGMIKTKQDYETLLKEIVRLLEAKLTQRPATAGFSVVERLKQDVRFYKVIVQGYSNLVSEPIKEVQIAARKTEQFSVRTENGDPRTYLHNPLREELAFVKERFIAERFSPYVVQFMKMRKLSLYLCSIETMLSYLVQKYAKNGVLTIVAVSKQQYIRTLDDRTLFVVLEKNSSGYEPLELCFGGIQNRIELVNMETLAFVADLRPDEIVRYYVNDEFEVFVVEYAHTIPEPSAIGLVGWWHSGFVRSFELYLEQNLKRLLAEFIFYAVGFLKQKDALKAVGHKSIFRAASENGFSIEEAFGKGMAGYRPLSIDLKTRFYDFLQTPYSEGFVGKSSEFCLDILFSVARSTEFDADFEKNMKLKEAEFRNLAGKASESSIFYKKVQLLNAEFDEKGRLKTNASAPLFSLDEYNLIKDHLLDIDGILARGGKEMIKRELDEYGGEFKIEFRNTRFYVFPPVIRQPVEVQVESLINSRGFKTFIYYGTAGSIIGEEVKGVPVESIVIPEVIYVNPGKYIRIEPEFYAPLPVENVLLADKSAKNFFNTDSFYKTHHIWVASAFQEHAGFLRSIVSVFKEKRVSVEMDVAPLAELCMKRGVGLGTVLYVTDELKGAEARSSLKGYNMRQLILSLLRGYDSKTLSINGRPIEDELNDPFRETALNMLRQLLA